MTRSVVPGIVAQTLSSYIPGLPPSVAGMSMLKRRPLRRTGIGVWYPGGQYIT